MKQTVLLKIYIVFYIHTQHIVQESLRQAFEYHIAIIIIVSKIHKSSRNKLTYF